MSADGREGFIPFEEPGLEGLEHRAREDAGNRRGKGLLAKRLQRLKRDAGLTQEALAAKSGVSRVTFARLEAGEQDPRYETLPALARGLGVSLETLLTD